MLGSRIGIGAWEGLQVCSLCDGMGDLSLKLHTKALKPQRLETKTKPLATCHLPLRLSPCQMRARSDAQKTRVGIRRDENKADGPHKHTHTHTRARHKEPSTEPTTKADKEMPATQPP